MKQKRQASQQSSEVYLRLTFPFNTHLYNSSYHKDLILMKKMKKKITNLNLTINVTTFCFISYLEVQVKYIHLVHVLDTLTDLFYKHHGIHLSQRTALIHNSLEQFASLHTE